MAITERGLFPLRSRFLEYGQEDGVDPDGLLCAFRVQSARTKWAWARFDGDCAAICCTISGLGGLGSRL